VSYANTIEESEVYDKIILGLVQSPGVVTLEGHDRVIGWDTQTGTAQSGGTISRTSETPIEFTAKFVLATTEEQEEWDTFALEIWDTIRGPKPKGKDIYHPDLARNEIKSVVLARMGGMKGVAPAPREITVAFKEYKPKKPKGGSASGSSTKKRANEPDPNQDKLDEIERLRKEYETP
jgi:hypothetical protein